ncbi:MAG: LacI family DNA-binding transcriptional regulator [Anaerolineae bacterium]|nr:LacI family DNA-binding transcriptional regulator [Anaerolineae bacterium]
MVRRNQTRVTIIDVAREANVSPKTVSRVMRGDGYVSEQTRQKIQSVIKRLGYRPNRAAQSLVSDRSGVIGVVIPDINNPFFPEVVRAIEDTALERDYNVLLFSTEARLDRERAAYQFLEDNRADGIISYFPFLPDSELATILSRQKATILVDHVPFEAATGIIRVDFYDAAVQAVNALVAAGRRNLCYFSPTESYYTFTERIRGIEDATALANISILPEHFWACGGSIEDRFQVARAKLLENPDIDGMICFNDVTAIAAMEACDDLHIPIPEQVAIIGFDDIQLSGLSRISLTTLRVPKAEIGVKAVQMLFDHMDGVDSPREIIMKTELIQRRSSPPPQVGGQAMSPPKPVRRDIRSI